MAAILPPLRFAALAVAGVLPLGAQTAPPPEAPPPAIAAENPAAGPAGAAQGLPQAESRPVSQGTAAMLAAGMPRYSPPKPPPPKPEGDLPDLRDIDKPKNEIIRLPKFFVRASKPPIFREQDINTAQGLADLAVRRYLSEFDYGLLNRLTIPLFGASAEARALEQYREDQRLSSMASLNNTADAIGRGGDAAESGYIKRAAADTYLRPIDWGGPVPSH